MSQGFMCDGWASEPGGGGVMGGGGWGRWVWACVCVGGGGEGAGGRTGLTTLPPLAYPLTLTPTGAQPLS